VRKLFLALSGIPLALSSIVFVSPSHADVATLTVHVKGFAAGQQPQVNVQVGNDYNDSEDAVDGVATFHNVPTPNCSDNHDGSFGNIFIEVDPNVSDLATGVKRLDCSTTPSLANDLLSGSILIELSPYSVPMGYWSGTLKDPSGTTLITYADICFAETGQGDGQTVCTKSDAQGNWALNKPANWAANGNIFVDSSILSIDASTDSRSNGSSYAQSQYIGAVAITGAGMSASGNSNLELRLSTPNFNYTVYKDSAKTQNAGGHIRVTLQTLGGQEIAKIQTPNTDSNGVAHFRLTSAQLGSGLLVQADPSYAIDQTVSSTLAQTTKSYADSDMGGHETGSGDSKVFADGMALLPINMKFVVTDPGTNRPVSPGQNGGASYWLTTGVNIQPILKGGLDPQTENAQVAVPAATSLQPSWIIELYPPGGSGLAIRSYSVVANSSGVVTSVTDLQSNAVVVPHDTVGGIPTYYLPLASANVQGFIYDPNSTDLDGNAFFRGEEESVATVFAQYGKFAQNLGDGTYHLQAGAGSGSQFANSSICTVVIAQGAITSATPAKPGGCNFDGTHLNFYLTAPNFQITVLDSSGNPLEAAQVSVGLQSWNTYGFTSPLGKTSLFIDTSTVSAANHHQLDSAPQKLVLQIFPGFGVSSSVSITCQSGDAGTVCADLPTIDLSGSGSAFSHAPFSVQLPAPNTFITVTDPTTHANVGPNAFVEIFKIVGGNQQYVSTGVTSLSGVATFYLSDTSPTTKYAVQVDPPFFNTTYYSGKTWDGTSHAGYAQSELNALNPALAIPNVSFTIADASTSSADAFGWVAAEFVNGSGVVTGWISGQGFNRNGSTKLFLPPTSTGDQSQIKLTFNPGPGVRGVSATCFVTVSAQNLVTAVSGCGTTTGTSLLSISTHLASGNFNGTVTHGTSGGQPVAGAVVVAKATSSSVSTSNGTVVFGTTGADGSYSLQLDTTVSWIVNVNPIGSLVDQIVGAPSAVVLPIGRNTSDNQVINW